MTRYRVSHRTSYRYGQPVTDGYTVACLLPRERTHQRVITSTVTTTPAADEFDELTDVFGNRLVQVGVHHRHAAFDIVAESVVEVSEPARPTSDATWEDVAEAARSLRGPIAVSIGPYRAPTRASTPVRRHELLDRLASSVFLPRRPFVEAVAALSTTIFETYAFDATSTDWATPLDRVLEQESGVCQDFAHLAVAVLRRLGLPASYVSGYIETDPPPGEVKSIGVDASHAWASVWFPGHGWTDFDPTNDHFPPTRHVTVGWGRDYADVSPVRGVVVGPSARQLMEVAVDMARLEPSAATAGAPTDP